MNDTMFWVYYKLLAEHWTLGSHNKVLQYLSQTGRIVYMMSSLPEDTFLARYYMGPKV